MKKYFKQRGRPPVLMEEKEWDEMWKKSEPQKTKKKVSKEEKEDGKSGVE